MIKKSRGGRGALGVAVTAGTVLALSAAAHPATAATGRHQLPGSTPTWLSAAKTVGNAKSSSSVSFGVLLNLRNQAKAEQQLKALSDPHSASYGKWLTNRQFIRSYAPSATSVHAVQRWLRGQGLTVTKTLSSGLLVEVTGSVAKVEKAFGTSIKNFRYKGAVVQSNASALSLSSSTSHTVLSAVRGVVGLDQAGTLKKPAQTLPGPPPGERYGVQPCSKYFGQKPATDKPQAYGKTQPYATCGYRAKQLEGAYGVSDMLTKGVDGSGVTVAITDAYASPTIYYDAQKYSSVNGIPQFTDGQFSQITPGPNDYRSEGECGPQGWYGEETLDVEAVHAMAPGAKIVYVGGTDCITGLDLAWAETIDSHVADIVTNSWGEGTDDISLLGDAYVQFYVDFSLEAALTGITVNFSTGDSGDYTQGGTKLAAKTLNFPSDVPFVTGVGGTSLQVGDHNTWNAEYGWQTAYSALDNKRWSPEPPGVYAAGGGGGPSQIFAQPFYQVGKVPSRIANYYGAEPSRTIPDIAMDGDSNTGMLVGQTQVFPDGTYWDQYRIGGTSVSSPLLAGTIAVADQYAGHSLGFVNPLYYQLLGTSAVHDITAPTTPQAQVRTDYVNLVDASGGLRFRLQTIDDQRTTIHSTPGYDDETGVGTPNGVAFFDALKNLAP